MNDANKALEESIQEAKKNRKRKCCVLIIVIVCAIVLVCVLVPFLCLVYYKQKKSTCAVGPDSTRRAPLHYEKTPRVEIPNLKHSPPLLPRLGRLEQAESNVQRSNRKERRRIALSFVTQIGIQDD